MGGPARPLLEQLDALTGADEAAALATLAFLAARGVDLDEAEVHAACRRAVLLLAAGGDPHRELDPDGRAVRAVADDLDTPARRAQLAAALGRLREDAAGLTGVLPALDGLIAAPDVAWRLLAAAMLADELSSDE